MKQINLKVAVRDQLGGGSAGRYRKAGKIPAVIYGESGSKNLIVDEKEFSVVAKQVIGKAALLEIEFEDGSESQFAVLKEVVRDALSDKAEHIDFKEVVRGKPMDAVIPFHFTGEAEGVKIGGGILDVLTHEINVRCRPRDLAENITIDVSALQIGQAITLADVKLPEGVEMHESHPEKIVVSCVLPASAVSTENAEAEVAEAK
jgi:large subunit ribosomal protein L25